MMKLIFGPTFNRLIEIIFIALGLLIIPLCVSNNRLDSLFSNNVIMYLSRFFRTFSHPSLDYDSSLRYVAIKQMNGP